MEKSWNFVSKNQWGPWVDLFYFFEHSSKRKVDYRSFQLFAEVDELEILKHCPTRWLSLERVVERTLNQLSALRSYFASHPDVEKPGKVKSLHERLQDPLSELTLLFFQFILPVLNAFNTVFQSDETKIGALKEEMVRLLRLLIVKFVQMKYVRGADLLKLDFADSNLQHDDSRIAVGGPARTLLDEDHISPHDKNRFFGDVRAFCVAAVKKMVAKFPFGDEVLSDLVILDFSKRGDYMYNHVVRLASKFAPSVNVESLKDEWDDFQLLGDNEVNLLDSKGQPRRLGAVWADIFDMKTSLGVARFPEITKVGVALMCLPHSNAD
ncbi:uncharacterized protein [Littorina saxatilis]|uniref:uncharacterized protein n=1 Tax=Littorina saxatilis TaxID=31220 RepID=UPI0038B47EF0